MSSVPTTYFMKELLSNPLWLPGGKSAPWEPVGDDTGVIATQDANIIFHLSNLAQRRTAGVVKIDEAGYIEQKKNSSASESPRRFQREEVSDLTAAPQSLSPRVVVAADPVVAASKSPESVVQPAKVRTGRAKGIV